MTDLSKLTPNAETVAAIQEVEAIYHLGSVLAYFSDIHPDDRCLALDEALAFYNAARPDARVEPSGMPYQRLVTEWPEVKS
jgi:hypothetical protein